jgi:hypothetical protein
MSSKLLAASSLSLLVLTGCSSLNQNNISPDPAFGEAAKYNAAVQTVDPDPVYSEEDAQPGDNGAKGAAAVRRYRTDSVKDVQQQTTTSGPS